MPFIGCFSVSQTCQESGSADYLEESTEDKHLLTGCWIIMLHGPPDIDLSALFFVFSYFTFAVKNSRFVFGQMDRSWLLLLWEEIYSAVDRGPCLSLGFIRC